MEMLKKETLVFMRIQVTDFDLEQIAASGQCFRMIKQDSGDYTLIAMGQYLTLSQQEDYLSISCTQEDWENIWAQYFDMNTDYGAIKENVDQEDTYLQAAIGIAGGVRILRQELWETIITFIISQQNHIPRIRKCVETICRRYGEKAVDEKLGEYYLFPTPEALSAATEDELRACGLGYRAPYLRKTAQMVCDGTVNLKTLPGLPYDEAKKELMKLCGVGIKVAECICLFALHHVDAFPIDTHIKDMLAENYPEGFPFERYKGYAGILQQYGFYYELHGK